MREIKFRAWYHWKHNHDNGWMEYLELGIDDLYQRTFLLSKKLPTLTGLKHFVKLDGFNHECDFELMQYTGLKDKNGKEIYEGDILSWDEEDEDEDIQVVVFMEGSFGVAYNNNDEYFDTCVTWDEVKIIGNIYENPELLTPTDKEG